MLLQSNESRRAYRVPVPDKYRLARYARARSSPLGGLRPGRRITKYLFQNFPPAETSYMPIVAPETNHRGYENPRRTLAGFSVGDLRTRFIDQCPSIHLLRVNGKKKTAKCSRISITLYWNKYFIRAYDCTRDREIVCNFVASAPVSRDLPCYSLFYVVRRASPSSRERGGDGVVEREEE